MRQTNRYGRIKERRFKFTRLDIEQLLRHEVRQAAVTIVPLPTERVDTTVEMDTDGIDLDGHELFVVIETYTDLREEEPAVPQSKRDDA